MPTGEHLELPAELAALVAARNRLRDYFAHPRLTFTLDGNLVGDLAEALAVEWFGVRLAGRRSETGIDGYGCDGRTVQIKATGTDRGPVFRKLETAADHLLFFAFDYDRLRARVVYNGPEHHVTRWLPSTFSGQRMVSMKRVREANLLVLPMERLSMARLAQRRL